LIFSVAWHVRFVDELTGIRRCERFQGRVE
jgi:hypothetical protein